MVAGRIMPDCEDILVYEKVPARIGDLRKLEENRTSAKGHGDVSSKIRRVQLGGNNSPSKIKDGDYIRIYWGTKPNVYSDLEIPSGYGPWIQIETPGGIETLKWSTDKWVNDNYSIEYSAYEGSWVLVEGVDVIATFGEQNTPQIKCGTYPTGYKFYRISGPPIDYKIVQFDHREDEYGLWHHTSLQVDLVAKDARPRV